MMTTNDSRCIADTPRFDPWSIRRPDRSLLYYYLLTSLLAGPAFPLAVVPLFFKYETLRYRFDENGVGMSWGILFRRETYLTYRRIQDIHLTRNIIQRWMGLATVSIQTASGSATPEMSIEGILDAEALRDFLYMRMRGAREEGSPAVERESGGALASPSDEATVLLRDIRDILQRFAVDKGAP
ncbi:MAG: PH domain-containing protein [Pirellulaceae bacterium]